MASAAEAFRRNGYGATSVDDLVSATGAPRASLYHVFGSKYGLFRRALDEAITAENPASAIGLDLALVALMELAPSDAAVRDTLARAFESGHLTDGALGSRLLQRAGIPQPDSTGRES